MHSPHPSLINRIALGTVQFGLNYGISNRSGKVGEKEVGEILAFAQQVGLNSIDTAINYGNSEQILGEVGVAGWQITSKLPEVPGGCSDVESWVFQEISGSLNKLKVNHLSVLHLHHPKQLTTMYGDELYRAILLLKEQGIVKKIGISIYKPEELDLLWSKYPFDVVQAPFNIFDRRIELSGWIKRLRNFGVEVHVRSIFLQGLLLMRPEQRPVLFRRWQSLFNRWHDWLLSESTYALQACVALPLSIEEIDRIIIGVDSLNNFREIVTEIRTPSIVPPKSLACADLDLLIPSRWEN